MTVCHYEFEYALRMFPKIEAAKPQPNPEDWTPGDTEGFDMFHAEAQSQKPIKKRGVLRVAPSDAFREQ